MVYGVIKGEYFEVKQQPNGERNMQTIAQATTTRRQGTGRKSGNVERSQVVKTVKEDGLRIEQRHSAQIRVSVEFKLVAAAAKSVAVAGSFNGWNAKKAPMEKNGDVWQT